MLRVQPNGARSWVFRYRRDGKPPRRVTLGKPGAVRADQARASALAFLSREKGGGKTLPPPPSGPRLKTFAAKYMDRRSPAWKPSTIKATMSYLNSAILSALGHLRVGSIARADVARFFHEYGHRRPGGANRCHEILRAMFDCAPGWGHRPEAAGNPCKGITRDVETLVGQTIERAITAENCAVAHSVKKIAKVGDIDHIVATPKAVWVTETKYRKVPPKSFPKVLNRIAANMKSVRQWAHGKTTVRGCLVLAFENAPVGSVFLARMETVATRESTRILGLRSRSSKRRFERRSGSRRVSMEPLAKPRRRECEIGGEEHIGGDLEVSGRVERSEQNRPGQIGVARTMLPRAVPGRDGDARSFDGWGQVGGLRSESQAHELIDGEGEDAEHQVAEDFVMAPHPDVASPVGVLDSAVHPLDGGPLVVAHSLGIAESGAAPGASLPGPFLLPVPVPAGVDVDDRNVA